MAASDNRRPSGGHTLFRYTAKDIDGRTVRGTMEAADYDALYAQLLEQGLYPQRVSGRGADRRPRTLRPQELSDLCRQLSTLLASGVSLVRALTIISVRRARGAAGVPGAHARHDPRGRGQRQARPGRGTARRPL